MQRSLRSYLTILGVVIGIFSVFILVSIGQGVTASVNSELEAFGSSTIVVSPGSLMAASPGPNAPPMSGRFFLKDLRLLERVDGIDFLTPYLYGRIGMEYKGEQLSATVLGIEATNFQRAVSTLEIEDGRFIREGDRQVLVIGSKIATEYFNDDLYVNSVVDIGGKKYRIAGIMKATGGTLDDTDTSIYAPIEDVREVLGSLLARDEIHGMYIITKEGYDVEEVAEDIKFTLRSQRGLLEGEEDFTMVTPAFISEQVGIITGLLTAFLGGIAAISLLVGSVTIANTMFMSVLERYSEIGVLKAIGAKQGDILKIFIFESAIIGLAGGAIGILIGIMVAQVLSLFAVPVSISMELAAFCLFFSLVIGVVAGYFPAKNAAQMVPVEALRTE